MTLLIIRSKVRVRRVRKTMRRVGVGGREELTGPPRSGPLVAIAGSLFSGHADGPAIAKELAAASCERE